MKGAVYGTLVEAIGDYLGKGIEFGKNASHFSHNGCYVFRLWSEDEKIRLGYNCIPSCLS